MKILLIGYSNLARQKIIKTFIKKKITFCVASKTAYKKIQGAYAQFKDYDEGLKKSGADLVYISLPNSLHYYWALKSLKAGFHVLVDKPICEKKIELKKLISCANKQKKLLAEAIFFNYHKQIKLAKIQIKNLNNLRKIHANFTIPYPKKNSILVSRKLGGGVLMDMGPYAAALPRIFSNKKNISKKVIITKSKSKLVTEFNLLCEYPKLTYSACFKFGGEYHNELFLHTDKKSIKLERVFSPPNDQILSLYIKKNGLIKIIKVKKDNSFENFFTEVLNKIKNKDFFYYVIQMQNDMNFRDKVLNT